ncbi:Retrovirus-related Pol polyprotein from transposon TNT 1-94 [Vitis vinifera]|uniref:Retrovirus-related Pol polyprotein from transposon TNT 1-94-like beta-barrel domain-containing protein n=2 Tax=Vitis vinifera TaxID=29760 RepID=A5B7H7_VITVI|nr:Retrovirus-related Pol polyprotein from transposon TNT 1-94 [Vitis vinifera]CAN82930.1 hypothetical protein VITISV_040770 [Vitis vinifera]
MNESSNEDRAATTIEDFLLMYDDDMINSTFDETSWVIDSGATTHATFCRDFYTSYTPGDFGVVKMGNNNVANVVGIDKTTTDLNEVEKAKSDSSDKLIDLEIIPPTSMEDQLDVETQNDQHGASDDPEPIEYVMFTDGEEPESFEEAIESEQKREWIEAFQDEMKSLHDNHTFELMKLSKGKRALKNKWEYKVKQEEHTSCPRYKARLAIKGFF